MKKNFNFLIKVLLLFLLSTNFAILNANTLKKTIEEVLSNNPVLKERIKNYKATLEDVKIAKSGWLPKIDYLGGIGYEKIRNNSTGYKYKNNTIYESTLKLVQNIFEGWGTVHRIKTHEARVAAAAYNYIEKANDITFNLVNYYIKVIKDRELLKIAQENIKINQAILQKVKKLYDSGLSAKSEVEKINASLALAQANQIVQRNNLKDSLYQLKFYYGRFADPDNLSVPIFTYKLPKTYKEGLNFALNNNPSILVQKYNIVVAKEDYKEKKSKYYPKFDIEATRTWNKDSGGVDGIDHRYRIALTVTYNIFNGFSDKATIQKGISKINQEISIENDLKRQTSQSFDLSWNAYKEIQNQLKYLKNYKKFATSTLRLYNKEYDLGKRSLLDLLSAQGDLINAKSQIVSAKYNLLFAKYRILDAMGIMLSEILKDKSQYYSKVGLLTEKKSTLDSLPQKTLKTNDEFLNYLEENDKK